MVNHSNEKLDRIFHALSDSTRREILSRIAGRECTVSELAAPFRMSLAAVSKHLKVLESAELLQRTVDGRIHRCSMNGEPLQEVADVIKYYQSFWNLQLDSLAEFLAESAQPKAKKPRKGKSK